MFSQDFPEISLKFFLIFIILLEIKFEGCVALCILTK